MSKSVQSVNLSYLPTLIYKNKVRLLPPRRRPSPLAIAAEGGLAAVAVERPLLPVDEVAGGGRRDQTRMYVF